MIVSQLLPAKVSGDVQAKPSTPNLQVGSTIQGRVTQISANGQGEMRLPDGTGFSFTGARGLSQGEQVRMQVLQLQPQITLQMAGSESGAAAKAAMGFEQSLMRGPDIMNQLVNLLGGKRGGAVVLPGQTTGKALFVSVQGQGGKGGAGLSSVLQKNLPNVSASNLLQGNAGGLSQLLEGGSRQQIAEAVRNLQTAARGLEFQRGSSGQVPPPGSQEAAAEARELSAARGALQRLGDLLAMQEILPRAASTEDGTHLAGYRIFWLMEGGLGEAMWRQEKNKGGGGDDDEGMTSVLLSLNMTALGMVQARLSYGEDRLQIGLAAEDQEALAALRGQIGSLRSSLNDAGLPLHTLELARLARQEMQGERQQMLGIGDGFSAEV